MNLEEQTVYVHKIMRYTCAMLSEATDTLWGQCSTIIASRSFKFLVHSTVGANGVAFLNVCVCGTSEWIVANNFKVTMRAHMHDIHAIKSFNDIVNPKNYLVEVAALMWILFILIG